MATTYTRMSELTAGRLQAGEMCCKDCGRVSAPADAFCGCTRCGALLCMPCSIQIVAPGDHYLDGDVCCKDCVCAGDPVSHVFNKQ